MIKSTLKKISQLIFILMIAYAGSFVLMEETSEKTEKTERSEEALHSISHNKVYLRSLAREEKVKKKKLEKQNDFAPSRSALGHALSTDFNVEHIYYASYLDTRI